MRLLWYNIQDPTDDQVNGFGFYRTVVDGTIPLLVAKKQMPDSPEYSVTHPWEASDCTNEELILLFGLASQMVFTSDGTNPAPCISTQQWEVTPYNHLNSMDDSGYRATYPWEVEWLDITQLRMSWAFSSTMEDSALGEEVEFDNDLPIGNHLTVSFQEHIFLAGDPDNPNHLYFSKRFRSESWPTENFIEIGSANDPITALPTIAGLLGVFTRETKYRVSGNATSGFTTFEAISHRGTRSPKSAVPSDKGIIFCASDGVFTTNLIGPDTKLSGKIEKLFDRDDQALDQEALDHQEKINFDYAEKISGAFFKGKYFLCYPAGDATEPNRMAVFSFDTEEWTIYSHQGGSLLVEADIDYLTMGGVDSYLYAIEQEATDNDLAISGEALTKNFSGASYNAKNLFLYYKVDADVPDGYSLNARFYIDEELIATREISGSRTNILNELPENSFGVKWRVGVDIDDDKGGTAVYGVAAVFIPLAAS